MKIMPIILLLAIGTPAQAKPGFSLGLGLGVGVYQLDQTSLAKSLAEAGRFDGNLMTGTLSDGLALRLAMAYNILGYSSVELGLTGHAWNMGGGGLGGSGHASMVAHVHPLQWFIPERDYDASIFLGGGYSIVGGGQPDNNQDRGLDGGALECGIAGRYFFTSWFSLGVDLRFTVPFFNRWVVDWEDGEEYELASSPDALFFSALLISSFHFEASK